MQHDRGREFAASVRRTEFPISWLQSRSVGDILGSTVRKIDSAEYLDGHHHAGHMLSPSIESDLQVWTRQRQSEKVSLTWKGARAVSRFFAGSSHSFAAQCVGARRTGIGSSEPITSFFLFDATFTDLKVVVTSTGKVLLHGVSGNISNGYYAIMCAVTRQTTPSMHHVAGRPSLRRAGRHTLAATLTAPHLPLRRSYSFAGARAVPARPPF